MPDHDGDLQEQHLNGSSRSHRRLTSALLHTATHTIRDSVGYLASVAGSGNFFLVKIVHSTAFVQNNAVLVWDDCDVFCITSKKHINTQN